MRAHPLRPPENIADLPQDVYNQLNCIEGKIDDLAENVNARFDGMDAKLDDILARAIVITDYSDD